MRQPRAHTGTRRLRCILAAIALAGLGLCIGCAKQATIREQPTEMTPVKPAPSEPPSREQPPALDEPAPAVPAQAAKPETAPPAKGPAKPSGSAADNQAARSTDAPADSREGAWAIPPGPLDDDKYVAIAIKLAAIMGGIPEDRRDADSKRLVMKRVLREANLTEEEFQAYTEQIAADAARREQVTGAIEKRLKTRYRGEVGTERPR